ncbi:MAG: MBL fold metallo-hydrolase [Planctomycetota bacterium]|nr:MBL fold metallo-hydrolase [Planctomycetota bacterium]
MRIGDLEVLSLLDGFFRLDGGAMFGVVPKPLWQKCAPADRKNRIRLAMRPMLVRGGSFALLVDAGIGMDRNPAWKSIYKIERGGGGVVNALNANGLKPEDITDVVVTHLHFDHAGGLTHRDAAGALRLAFPRAIVHIRRSQWEWALTPSEREAGSLIAEDLQLLKAEAKLNLLETDTEVQPGVFAVETGGHAPGHQIVIVGGAGKRGAGFSADILPWAKEIAQSANVVDIRSDSQQKGRRDSVLGVPSPPEGVEGAGEGDKKPRQASVLVFCGDLIPTAAHVRVPYVMAYDSDPNTTVVEKRKLLARAASERWLLVFEHDPKVVATFVEPGARHYALRKVEL